MTENAVLVYSKKNCFKCEMAKKLLMNNDVPFVTLDVEEDESAMDYLKEIGVFALPLVTYSGTQSYGFNPDALHYISDLYKEKQA